MEDKVTERDIHSILDKFGPAGEETFGGCAKVVSSNDKRGPTVLFVDPLKAAGDLGEAGSLGGEESNISSLLNSGSLIITDNMDESDEERDMASVMNTQWKEMFSSCDAVEMLKTSAASGKLGSTYFRSVCWRLFWECLSENMDGWLSQADKQREEYEGLRLKHLTDPYEAGAHADLSVNNPLSQAEESPWHQYFQDNELRTTLNQDLDRLFPEHHFFQRAEIKTAMLHILFCFAREHPLLNYRQGMHEILACIIHVFWQDYSKVASCPDLNNKEISSLHDMKFIEHDCYHLFRHIMDVIEPWYINVSADVEAIAKSKTSAITKKLNRIQSYMLKRYDVQLYSYLKQLDIQPQLYGIRWLRLLFGREFQLSQLPIIWDVLFSQGITLDFADYFFLAMLVHIRGQILKADYATCLSYLMKYPCAEDLRVIIRKAFFLRNHKPTTTNTQVKKSIGQKPTQTPKAHPLKARLKAGISEEQQFASALGSSPLEKGAKGTSKSRRGPINWPASDFRSRLGSVEKREDNSSVSASQTEEPGSEDAEGRSEFIRDHDDSPSKSSIGGHISNVLNKHKVGSPGQIIAKLATKTKTRSKGDILAQLAEDHQRLQQQVSMQQREIERINYLNIYCGEKMDAYINVLQKRMLDYESITDEAVSLCIAGLKQIKEFLKGSPEARVASADLDIDLSDIDKHLSNAMGKDMPTCNIVQALEATFMDKPMPENADYEHFEAGKRTKCLPEKVDSGVSDASQYLGSSSASVASAYSQKAVQFPVNTDPLQSDIRDSGIGIGEGTSSSDDTFLGQNLGEDELTDESQKINKINEDDPNASEVLDSDSVQKNPGQGEKANAQVASPLHDSHVEGDVLLFDKELASISSRFATNGS